MGRTRIYTEAFQAAILGRPGTPEAASTWRAPRGPQTGRDTCRRRHPITARTVLLYAGALASRQSVAWPQALAVA